MKTDGRFELTKYIVTDWEYDRPLRLRPFGDVHRDSDAHSTHKWQEFLSTTRERDQIFLGLGDYLDSYSGTERPLVYNEILHDTTRKREERLAKERVRALAKELHHLRGRTIGLLSGNHFVQFADGTTGDQLLAAELSTKHLGVCAAIRISITLKGKRGVSMGVDIFAHHGRGAGTTAAGKFLAVERLAQICEADIFLMGHNHSRGVFPLGDKLRIVDIGGNLFIRARQAWIGRTGAFLRSYVPGESSYAVDAAMVPSNIGWVEFQLFPRRIREGGQDRNIIEIKAIQ